jgi:thiamine pyrophosphokinase
MRIGVVLAGGEFTRQCVPPILGDEALMADAFVVAADSGLDLAEQVGIVPDLVVGDFDSVTPDALDRARRRGIEVVEFPTAKDRTDLELAFEAVLSRGVDRLVVLGGGGGRLDHLVANIALLARLDIGIEAWLDDQFATVLAVGASGPGVFSARLAAGGTLSVLAWGGPAIVSETGVLWPLDHHRLEAGSTLGVSNESLGGEVEITVHEGRAVVILPNAADLQ